MERSGQTATETNRGTEREGSKRRRGDGREPEKRVWRVFATNNY